MSVRFVDFLEMIEVEVEDGDAFSDDAAYPRGTQRAHQALDEGRAADEAGQGVVQGQLTQGT